MGNYKDRGILKWAPFDALDGHSSMLEEMIFNMNKREKRSLSDDEYDELNDAINEAVSKNSLVSVDYYHDGYNYQSFGLITKVDMINKKIILNNNEELDVDSILSIELQEV